MKITREEALIMARRETFHEAEAKPCDRCRRIAALIMQAVKETAEECARLCVEETEVRWGGSMYSRYEDGNATLSAAAKEIRSAFGIAEVNRGDKK